MPIDWTKIILGFGGVTLGGFLAAIFGWFTSTRLRKQDRMHLAASLAMVLGNEVKSIAKLLEQLLKTETLAGVIDARLTDHSPVFYGNIDKIDLLPDGLVDPLLALHTTVRMQDGWPTQTIDASATIPTATLSIFRVLLHRQIGFAKALQKDLERFSTDPKGFVATPMPYKIDEPQAEDQSAV